MSAHQRVERLEAEVARLKQQIEKLKLDKKDATDPNNGVCTDRDWDGIRHALTGDQVQRYSRQIILPSFGVESQSRVCHGSVLVVGAGGLGSPALLYLAAAGVGRLGVVDKDTVELSNIHRQVIHKESSVNIAKTTSAATAIHALNSSVVVEEHQDGFTPQNALELVEQYDVIIDASDNAPTRYLINDACCIAKKPLVSGAAIGTDGQLTVYCYGKDGPCYRCLFPIPPTSENCSRCVDAGVLGPVPGIIGTMQALEAIKILSGVGEVFARKLLIMDALFCRFHVVKLRSKNVNCESCGTNPYITRDNLSTFDYFEFTGQPPTDAPPVPLRLVHDKQRITVHELKDRLSMDDHILLDVRAKEQFNICRIPGAINTPWKNFETHVDYIREMVLQKGGGRGDQGTLDDSTTAAIPVTVICRRGNDSQRALKRLHELGFEQGVDVIGGVESWAKSVDPTFPLY